MKAAWTRSALRHVEEIQDYIAQDSPRAANKVANSLIDRTNALLSDTTMAGRLGRARGTRELVFPDLPTSSSIE
ncbi:MAG: type II toxin-antitoxin system RelE/ParE family toxin [Devosia sp.]|uniref:type II toxin-antitoxin system RelE/ParE family toxin n=1 Tax=Devosia sp. TaxID=1871048 RepID=UPI0033912939